MSLPAGAFVHRPALGAGATAVPGAMLWAFFGDAFGWLWVGLGWLSVRVSLGCPAFASRSAVELGLLGAFFVLDQFLSWFGFRLAFGFDSACFGLGCVRLGLAPGLLWARLGSLSGLTRLVFGWVAFA